MSQWRFRYHPALRADVTEAAGYYARINPNLVGSFTAAVRSANRSIRPFPESHREFLPGWRRVSVPRFPYILLFAVRDRTVYVTALVHTRRDPKTTLSLLEFRDLTTAQRSETK